LSCKRKLRRVNTFESTQREMEIENVSQKLSSVGEHWFISQKLSRRERAVEIL
jgi:hypothetical protein